MRCVLFGFNEPRVVSDLCATVEATLSGLRRIPGDPCQRNIERIRDMRDRLVRERGIDTSVVVESAESLAKRIGPGVEYELTGSAGIHQVLVTNDRVDIRFSEASQAQVDRLFELLAADDRFDYEDETNAAEE